MKNNPELELTKIRQVLAINNLCIVDSIKQRQILLNLGNNQYSFNSELIKKQNYNDYILKAAAAYLAIVPSDQNSEPSSNKQIEILDKCLVLSFLELLVTRFEFSRRIVEQKLLLNVQVVNQAAWGSALQNILDFTPIELKNNECYINFWNELHTLSCDFQQGFVTPKQKITPQ